MSNDSDEDGDELQSGHDSDLPADDGIAGLGGVVSNSAADNKWSKNGYGEGVTKQGGKFSKEESEIVRKAVEEYCALKQISPARLCAECDHKAELKGAWMEIARRLPHRSVQSVYRHGLRSLHPYKRGPWTEQECQMLLDLVQRMGKKWAAIQSKINRSADSCRDKYREMSDTYVKGRWKEGETEILKRLIREHLGADMNADIKELGKMVEREGVTIPWSAISKRMGRRSRLSCFKKWQKLTGIYSFSDKAKGTKSSGPEVKLEESSVDLVKEHIPTATAQHDYDVYLVSVLASSGIGRSDEVAWESLQIDQAQERWQELIQEMQSEGSGNELLGLPLSGVAQVILDRKTSAKMAAETVEAVDLPTPETLNSREI